MSKPIKIEIFGSGCTRCEKMEKNARIAVQELGITKDQVIFHTVKDIDSISERGVLLTPALAIDGEIIIEGKVASVDLIKGHLKSK